MKANWYSMLPVKEKDKFNLFARVLLLFCSEIKSVIILDMYEVKNVKYFISVS